MMPMPVIVRDVEDDAVAGFVARRLAAAMGRHPGLPVAMTMPGGATPFPILEKLVRHDLAWDRLEVWPGDDRIVPENSLASNLGRIRAAFAATGARVVPLEERSRPPHFALTWLGMGGDGHIASLFPNADPRCDDPLWVRRLMPDPLPPEAPFERISLTIPALLASDEIVFVIRGEGKLALFEAAARGENDLPVARLLAAARQPVTCFA
jgi:6-phosphogluconolactonase